MNANLDPETLGVIACPACKQALTTAPNDLVDEINRHLASGSLSDNTGKKIEQIQGALICSKQNSAFPIRGGVPLLFIDNSISLRRLTHR